MISHTIVFAMLFIATAMIPIAIWVKLLIMLISLALHFLVDYLSGECVIITDITQEALDIVIHGDFESKFNKELEERFEENDG